MSILSSQKSNLLFVHNNRLKKTSGGAERDVYNLMDHLKCGSRRQTFLFLEGSSCGAIFCKKGVRDNLVQEGLQCGNPFRTGNVPLFQKLFFHLFDLFNIKAFVTFLFLLKKRDFGFVFFHGLKGFGFLPVFAAYLKGIPFAFFCHDYYNICLNSCCFKKSTGTCRKHCAECFLMRYFPAFLANKARFVIFYSNKQRLLYNKCNWFKKSHSIIMPPFINSSDYKAKTILKNKVGFLGRLDCVKGFDIFLETVLLLKNSNISFFVQTFNDDPMYKYYKDVSVSINNLFWVNKSPKSFLRSLDYLVFPSLWEEPFGRVLLESLSVGTPVIGFDTGALKEIIQNKKSGFICPKKDSSTLSKCILSAYKNKDFYKYMSKNCIKRSLFFRNLHFKGLQKVLAKL